MVKDEADVIAATVGHMLGQVDHVIVADNGSTDGTRDILDTLGVEVIDDPEIAYQQSRKMTTLAHRAIDQGADWIVPFDADEIWYSPHGSISALLEAVGDRPMVVSAELYDHVATGLDDDDPNPVTRIGWRRRDPLPLPKVACRSHPGLEVAQGNHDATFDGIYGERVSGLVVRHFPYRSVEQFISKVRNGAAAYAATDFPAEVGAHWRQWGELLAAQGAEALADVFRTWYWRADPVGSTRIEGERQPGLLYDPAPITRRAA